MLIEGKIKIGHDSMFNIPQTNSKSAHSLNKMALVQFQCSRTVPSIHTPYTVRIFKIDIGIFMAELRSTYLT